MSRKITFDELVARREQRENDKLKVGMLTIPGTGVGLEARMPPQKAVLELYGELGSAKDTLDALRCGNHALYVCCPQLQDRALQKELGVDENPMGILDVLFTPCLLYTSAAAEKRQGYQLRRGAGCGPGA